MAKIDLTSFELILYLVPCILDSITFCALAFVRIVCPKRIIQLPIIFCSAVFKLSTKTNPNIKEIEVEYLI